MSFLNNGVIYQLATDPDWGRVLIGNWDMWVHAYNNAAGPGGPLGDVEGVDVSARRNVYLADRGKGRVVIATLDLNVGNLINPSVLASPLLIRPIDVAWDGGSSPLSTDYLYVVDDSTSSVTYWTFNAGVPSNPLWSYGTKGAGTGEFWHPTSVCVGKTAGSTGGTQFTNYFYVVDRGNKRVVWLSGGTGGPGWINSASVSGWDPIDCAVDHFGNVYVVDWGAHRIHKFTSALTLVASYGTYGKGANNLNTFAFPHAISVPCGLKVVNNQTVWYCEGRVVTAELWSDSSGAVEHYLGLDAYMTGPYTSLPAATITDSATDHAYHYVKVLDWNSATVRYLANDVLMPPGAATWWWDGHRDDGTWAAPGNYHFWVYITSAYGCSYSWCQRTFYSSTFWWNGQTCGGGGNGPALPCGSAPAGNVLAGETEPTALFLHQRLFDAARPLARLEAPQIEAGLATDGTPAGSLTDIVKRSGVRGLSFSVTRAAASGSTSIRVYTLSGRLVRALVNERLDPGFYEIGWDGNDDRGRPAAPGVYVAVMTVGSFHATQRLVLRQP